MSSKQINFTIYYEQLRTFKEIHKELKKRKISSLVNQKVEQ